MSSWDWDYTRYDRPYAFGDETTYQLGMAWLSDCKTVEDWGAGMAFARKFVVPGQEYTAIDGHHTSDRFVDHIADLREWQSRPDGIFMRHILEHNRDWRVILDNALESFQQKMALIMFTPFRDVTAPSRGDALLDIHFRREDLAERFIDLIDHEEHLRTGTQFSEEHIFYLRKPAA